MCGICGFTGRPDQITLQKMTHKIFHRGPDEDGYYSGGKINLGVRRLSIIDVETGQQPVHNENKTIWLVFNGEIYNFIELRKELEKKGHQFYTDHSDSEILVHLYEEYGDHFMHKLNGMFAIALWDSQQEKLLLIRDRMGVKPLFYATINENIIFGSEIKAILNHPDYLRAPNFEALYHYFTFENIPAPLTAFKGIYSVLPGEMLTFSKGYLHAARWWKIKFEENNYEQEEVVRKELLSLLEDATRLRMRSDVPFGAYLSGGIDSSTVVGLMSRFSDKPIKTFSLGYEDKLMETDLHYARKVSKAYKTEHYEYIMSPKELIDDIGSIIEAFDQPFSGSCSVFFITKLIREYVKVALSGDGADELFGSYLSHKLAQPVYVISKLYNKIGPDRLKKFFDTPNLKSLEKIYRQTGGDEVKLRYNLYLFSDEEKSLLLSDNFKQALNKADSFALLKKNFSRLTATTPLNRVLEMEWNTQLPDHVLAVVDFLSMAHSVEVRSPFLDYRLVEFMATLPGHWKIREGNIKDILKKTVKTFLPQGIIARRKKGFDLPVCAWIMEKLEEYCRNTLSERRLKKHHLLDLEAVRNIWQVHYSRKRNNAKKIWNLMMFQIWWEKYFE